MIKCQECSSEFKKLRGSKGRFCSMSCANKWQSKNPYRGPRKPRLVKPCKECLKSIEMQPSWNDRVFFCSNDCQMKWRSRIMKAEKNPNWQGGMNRNSYPYEWSQARKEILKRDGNQCVNPACNQKTSKINIHHIDYNKENLNSENLICLCVSCNARANFQRIFWKGYYQNYMKFRKSINYEFQYKRGDIVIDLQGQWASSLVRA